MENFAAVIRTLLARIRTFEATRSDRDWPSGPAAATDDDPSTYRVTPTAWGVPQLDRTDSLKPHRHDSSNDEPTSRPNNRRGARRQLELTVFALPVPRGLPSI